MMPGRFCAVFPPGNTNAWMLWHYQTSDNAVAVLRPRYFDDMRSVVQGGDWIAVNSMRADALGYEAMLLVVHSVGQDGVRVGKIDARPAALMKGPPDLDAEIDAAIAAETVRRSA
jgi:hypothetical protein